MQLSNAEPGLVKGSPAGGDAVTFSFDGGNTITGTFNVQTNQAEAKSA